MLSSSEISHIASLSKLELDSEERQRLAGDLSRVLDYIAVLDQVEITTEDVPEAPVATPRADTSRPGLAVEPMLQNAPESLDRFVLVPAIK